MHMNNCTCAPAGCKSNNVSIVYTPWANLKKTASMEVGQVGKAQTRALLHVCDLHVA